MMIKPVAMISPHKMVLLVSVDMMLPPLAEMAIKYIPHATAKAISRAWLIITISENLTLLLDLGSC
ncbi:hypothetical protein [Dehalogenimonas etheniformans]|uniref:hypothetical protein n=1 Tax=Dehalogenimonas etheniformans TaxID=1536648 RepID=UPI0013924820|nr:hypothetical protein [Dehalogenimonas etheniformans]QNT76153.1 hypothetical protein HX448_05335 [Dehalogenimonas etheniformans]